MRTLLRVGRRSVLILLIPTSLLLSPDLIRRASKGILVVE